LLYHYVTSNKSSFLQGLGVCFLRLKKVFLRIQNKPITSYLEIGRQMFTRRGDVVKKPKSSFVAMQKSKIRIGENSMFLKAASANQTS